VSVLNKVRKLVCGWSPYWSRGVSCRGIPRAYVHAIRAGGGARPEASLPTCLACEAIAGEVCQGIAETVEL
jgi:hypothetical protein